MRLKFLVLAPLALNLSAAYQNLIATEDGTKVFFTASTSISRSSGFVGRSSSVEALTNPISDSDGAGNTLASTAYGTRSCLSGLGSTCFIQSDCKGDFSIQGNGTFWEDPYNSALIRFNRKGNVVWIQRTHYCPIFGIPSMPSVDGLYDVASRQVLTGLGGTKLANQSVGRRAITDDGRALVLSGNQLNWLDRTGLQLIPTTAGVFEAVIDTTGANIVYSEADGGPLHWISNGQDLALGFSGLRPALTSDGGTLVFLDASHSLQAYVRQSATPRPIAQDAIGDFSLGGDFVFAVNDLGQLVRIGLLSGQQTVWVQPAPRIDSLAALSRVGCDYICYGPLEPRYLLSPGMIVLLQGNGLANGTLAVTLEGQQAPVVPISDSSAYFQVPHDFTNAFRVPLTIADPSSPVIFQTFVSVQSQSIACLATVHEDFTGPVTTANPARPGETVHVFLTGWPSPEPIPDGTPNPTDRLIPILNPPSLFDPAAAEILFFGLAPGEIGIDQLDLRIKSSVPVNLAALADAFACNSIPVGANP